MPIKSLDDLSDQPQPNTPILTPDAEEFVFQARGMLDQEKFEFAWDTIDRMYQWVKANGVVTIPMRTALENIATSVYEREQGRGKSSSRRYEGFRRG